MEGQEGTNKGHDRGLDLCATQSLARGIEQNLLSCNDNDVRVCGAH
jgi:hypothetical protein